MIDTGMFSNLRAEIGHVPGLDAALLADLYDLVLKYGTPSDDGQVLRLVTDAPKRIHVSVCVPPAKYRHVLVGTAPGMALQGEVHAYMFGPPDAVSAVI